MELPLTRAALPMVEWLDEAESTNASLRELVARAASRGETLPHGTLLVTGNQLAGRGRRGRSWDTPPHTAIAASLLLQPVEHGGSPTALPVSWLPLLAASAVADALQPLFRGCQSSDSEGGGYQGDPQSSESADGVCEGNCDSGFGAGRDERGGATRVGVKWPNDVHVRDEEDAIAGRPGAKLAGILGELLPSGDLILGFGVNLLQAEWQLPTERAGSVLSCGGDTGGAESLLDHRGADLADRVLARACTELLELIQVAHRSPAAARKRVLRDSLTIGAEVRVHLPGGEIVDGRASGLAEDGALIVDRPTGGQLIVNAADIEHLR